MKPNWLSVLMIVVACALGTACGDDSDGGGSGDGDGDNGGAGNTGDGDGDGDGDGPGDGDGDAGGLCVNTDEEVNLDCPIKVGPEDGVCAPRGECCHRASNATKVDALGPDESAVLEYRLVSVQVSNHPDTVSQPTLLTVAATRADTCAGEQCLLWRFELPRAGGEFVAGTGKSTIGIGRYNCDGTYSFYGDSAAPPRDGISDDPTRWAAVEAEMMVDPDLEGPEARLVPFATNPNQDLARSPFTDPAMDMAINWELVSQGFDILEIDTSDDGLDCIGSRAGTDWITGGSFVSYHPLEVNSVDILNELNHSYCQLLAFGILPEGEYDRDCLATPRCMPGEEGCDWVKLPDSLCPETDDEKALWRCHLGAEGNPNAEEGYPSDLNCTADAPTEVADPGAGGSAGQCCDPIGDPASGLPACNAYRTLANYVAAAAEITDAPSNELPPTCD